MTTEQHRDRALNHLAAVELVTATLPDLHRQYHLARDNGFKPTREVVASRRCHEAEAMIEHGLTVAQIHAALDQGEQLRRIGDALEELLGYLEGQTGRISA